MIRFRSIFVVSSLLLLAGALGGCASGALAPYAELSAHAPSTKGNLTVRFMGTSTLSFADGSMSIMIDGFFSRPGPLQVRFGQIEPDEDRIEWALGKAKVERAAAIFVAHSHYDHAMDSAVVAHKTGAVVYGSESTANIVRGSGTNARYHVFSAGEVVQLGDFRVTAFETPHSPCPRYLGTINEPLRPPARASAYKEGGNYSFLIEHPERRMLVVTSANFTPGKFRGVAADIVFLAIGALGKHPAEFTSDYWREVVLATGAKRVILIHWDDFTRSLKKPLRPLPQPFDDFDETMLRLLKLAARDGVALRLPEAFTPIDLIVADQAAEGHLALRESAASPGEHVLVVEGGDHRPLA